MNKKLKEIKIEEISYLQDTTTDFMNALLKRLKEHELDIICSWTDEYGGIQSVSRPFSLHIVERR